MDLTSQSRQEDLSKAYILAIAAKAGYDWNVPGQHDVGEDLQIIPVIKRGRNLGKYGRPLFIQAKASYDYEIKDNYISYDLKTKNYNQLIDEERYIPLILVLYCMPRNHEDWLYICEDNTILKHCGYWTSLRGCPPTENTEKIRIRIPKNQIFTEASLKEILTRIQDGSPP